MGWTSRMGSSSWAVLLRCSNTSQPAQHIWWQTKVCRSSAVGRSLPLAWASKWSASRGLTSLVLFLEAPRRSWLISAFANHYATTHKTPSCKSGADEATSAHEALVRQELNLGPGSIDSVIQ